MRSISVYFRSATADQLREWLDKRLPTQKDPWVVLSGNQDAVLYVNFYDEPSLRINLEETNVPFHPTAALAIDVSGRHAGDDEVRALLESILLAFDGVADDGYTRHVWTIDEIRQRCLKDGHPFFDYKGWYEEHSRQS